MGDLPKFERPPVVEVSVGVQFRPRSELIAEQALLGEALGRTLPAAFVVAGYPVD